MHRPRSMKSAIPRQPCTSAGSGPRAGSLREDIVHAGYCPATEWWHVPGPSVGIVVGTPAGGAGAIRFLSRAPV